MLAAWRQHNRYFFRQRPESFAEKSVCRWNLQVETALFLSCSSEVKKKKKKKLGVASFGQRGIMCHHELIGCEKTWTRAKAVTSAGDKRGALRYDNKWNIRSDSWEQHTTAWCDALPDPVAKSYLELLHIVPDKTHYQHLFSDSHALWTLSRRHKD